MKLFGFIFFAGLMSLIVGLVMAAVLNVIFPCYSDKAGCGMGDAFRLFFVPGYVLVAMVVFGIAAVGKNRERPLKLAAIALALAAMVLVFLAIGDDLTKGRMPSMGNLSDALQVSLTYWVVVLVQWRVIRGVVLEREAGARTVA